MDCDKIRECCSDYLDNCLGEDTECFDRHLSECPACRKSVTHLRFIITSINCLPTEEAPQNFLVRLNERIDAKEKGWFARLKIPVFGSVQRQALAMAATIALIILSAFFIYNHQSPDDYMAACDETGEVSSAGGSLLDDVPSGRSLTSPPSEMESYSGKSTGSGPFRSVALNQPPFLFPDSAVPRISGPAGLRVPRVDEFGDISARAPKKAPYVDKIVILEASHPSIAAGQVRRLAGTVHAGQKDYSETIIFILVSIEKSDYFLHSLETIGSPEIIPGPIDRGLPYDLLQVIIIPER